MLYFAAHELHIVLYAPLTKKQSMHSGKTYEINSKNKTTLHILTLSKWILKKKMLCWLVL